MIIKKYNGLKDVRAKFDGVCDIVNFVSTWKEDIKKPEFKNIKVHRYNFEERRKFTDNKNVEDVIKDLENPVVEMAGAIATADAMISDDIGVEMPISRRRRARRLEDGEEIDIDRWVNRETDIWEEMRREESPKRVVRILVNMSTNCAQGKNEFKWRTSTVIAIARILEEARVNCEIVGVMIAGSLFGCNSNLQVEFPIKRVEQLLDVESIAYCAGSMSFFRVIGLSTFVKIGDVIGAEVEDNLGYPQDLMSVENEDDFIVSKNALNEDNAKHEVERFVNLLNGSRGINKGE